MTDDKLNITIRIAGLKPMALKINRAEEEHFRNAEYQLNRLWGRWCERFPDKSSTEVLAMVAYQFAQLFYAADQTAKETSSILENFENELDGMIHGTDNGEIS